MHTRRAFLTAAAATAATGPLTSLLAQQPGDPVIAALVEQLAGTYRAAKRVGLRAEHVHGAHSANRVLSAYVDRGGHNERIKKNVRDAIKTHGRAKLLEPIDERQLLISKGSLVGLDVRDDIADLPPVAPHVRAATLDELVKSGVVVHLGRVQERFQAIGAHMEKKGASLVLPSFGGRIVLAQNPDCWTSWQILIGQLEAMVQILCLFGLPELFELCVFMAIDIFLAWMMMWVCCGMGWC